jgi:hypothetical protein
MLTIKTVSGALLYNPEEKAVTTRNGHVLSIDFLNDRLSSKDTLWRVTKEDGDRRHFELFRSAVNFALNNPGAIVEEVQSN